MGPRLLLCGIPWQGMSSSLGICITSRLSKISYFLKLRFYFLEQLRIQSKIEGKVHRRPAPHIHSLPANLSHSGTFLQPMNRHNHPSPQFVLGSFWECCTFCVSGRLCNDTYPLLQHRKEYFHCHKTPLPSIHSPTPSPGNCWPFHCLCSLAVSRVSPG